MTTNALRDFATGDEAALIAVIEAALAADRLPGITRQDLVHGVERMSGDPAGTIVATEDGAIVGFCMPRMDELMVHPAHRRRGHGRRIVEAWRAHFALATSLRKLDRAAEARTHLRVAIALSPGTALYRQALARLDEANPPPKP